MSVFIYMYMDLYMCALMHIHSTHLKYVYSCCVCFWTLFISICEIIVRQCSYKI